MKEYTLLALFSIIVVLITEYILKTNIFKKAYFYTFLFVIFIFKFLVNGYLTSKQIVIYNPKFFLNIRIGSIPLEDFLFGFSMISMSIIFWEYFISREK